MHYVIAILLFSVVGAVFYHANQLRKRAETLAAKVERALKNRTDKPVDFFKTAKARRRLGVHSLLQRIADQIKVLRADGGDRPVDLTWSLRSLSGQLDRLEEEFSAYNRDKIKKTWGEGEV
ncbi:MAG: hypothetical protein AAF492_05305 [Verrucomicrobiota bacterium]